MSAESKRRRRMARATPDNFVIYIMRKAAGASIPLDCYWIAHASEFRPGEIECEAGSNFCHPCASALVDKIYEAFPERAEYYEIAVDGGWGTEHDSPPNCHTCGAKLQGSLTDAGVEYEMEALCDFAKPDPGDVEEWDALLNVVENQTRFPMFISIHTMINEDADRVDFWRRVGKIVRRSQRIEKRGK
jgi:hypothetical protein